MDKSTQTETPQQPSPGTGKKKAFLVVVIAIALLIMIAVTRRAPEPVPPVEPDVLVKTTLAIPASLPAEPVAIAKAPIPMNQPNLLGLVRLRNLHTLPDRLGRFVQAVDPAFDTDMLTEAMLDAGINPQRAQPDGNAALFAWKPDPLMSVPNITALLPLSASDTTPSDSALPSHYTSVDGSPQSTLFAWKHSDLVAVSPISAELLKIAQAPMDGDLSASLNLHRIWENYGPVAKMYFRGAQGFIGIGLMQQPALAEHPQAVQFISETINSVSTMIFDALDQSRFLTLDIGVDGEQLQVSLTSEAQPETDLADCFSGGPLTAPDLLSLLPDTEQAIFISQETVADWNPTLKIMRNVLRPVVATLGSEPAGQLDDLIENIRECGRTTVATSMRSAARGETEHAAVAAEYIILAENPIAMHRLLKHQIPLMFQTGAYAHLYRMLGIDCKVTTETVAATSIDQPIHRFTITYAPTDDDASLLPEEAIAAMQQTNVYELVSFGPYVLLTMDTPVNVLAQHVATTQPTDAHPLFTSYEPGMAAVGHLNVSALAAMIQRELEKEQHQLTINDWTVLENMEPVTGATYLQEGSRKMQIRIPANVLAGLQKLAENWKP